jgi:hypothetical protein
VALEHLLRRSDEIALADKVAQVVQQRRLEMYRPDRNPCNRVAELIEHVGKFGVLGSAVRVGDVPEGGSYPADPNGRTPR